MNTKVKIANGDDLRRERLARGWSQKQVAELIGINASTVSRYETGRYEIPLETCKTLSRIMANHSSLAPEECKAPSLDFDIRAERLARGWQQSELAQKIEVSKDVMFKLERGKGLTSERINKLKQVFAENPVATQGIAKMPTPPTLPVTPAQRVGFYISLAQPIFDKLQNFANENGVTIETVCESVLLVYFKGG